MTWDDNDVLPKILNPPLVFSILFSSTKEENKTVEIFEQFQSIDFPTPKLPPRMDCGVSDVKKVALHKLKKFGFFIALSSPSGPVNP